MSAKTDALKAQLAAGGVIIDSNSEVITNRERVMKRVIALDASSSMAGPSMLDAQIMARRRLNPEDGLFIFNDMVHYVDQTKIGMIIATGLTAMGPCIKEIIETVKGIQEIILITDGMPNIDFEGERHLFGDFCVDELISFLAGDFYGVTIHTIGIGWDCEKEFLEEIAGLTGGQAQHIENTEALDQAVALLECNSNAIEMA